MSLCFVRFRVQTFHLASDYKPFPLETGRAVETHSGRRQVLQFGIDQRTTVDARFILMNKLRRGQGLPELREQIPGALAPEPNSRYCGSM
jgi:hypothetical protein